MFAATRDTFHVAVGNERDLYAAIHFVSGDTALITLTAGSERITGALELNQGRARTFLLIGSSTETFALP